MLRRLLFLSALIGLGAGAELDFFVDSVFDISSRPITFYGQKYKQIYMNLTGDHFTLCFNGFFNPRTKQDCIVGPPASMFWGRFAILPHSESTENIVHSLVPTIKNNLKGTVSFEYTFGASVLKLHDFGTQAALHVFIDNLDKPYVFNAVINGTTVDTFTFTKDSYGNTNGASDISGCRHSGVMYKPGTVISHDPETFSDLICNEAAVIETRPQKQVCVQADCALIPD